MGDDIFKNREAVKQQMNLPGTVDYSFVGESSPEYHAKVEEIMTRVVGEENIRQRSYRQSSKGSYTAYKFNVFHMEFHEVEEIYREICALPGTKFVV